MTVAISLTLVVGGLVPSASADPTSVLDPHILNVDTNGQTIEDDDGVYQGLLAELVIQGTFLRPPNADVSPPGVSLEFPEVTFSGTGIELDCCFTWGPHAITLQVRVAVDAPLGPRDVTVTDYTGASDTCEDCLTVLAIT